ncbi:MAG: hypothetical protein ABI706_02455 [Ilumatobacteraceae bacterium]
MNAGGSGVIEALTGTWGPRVVWLAVGIIGAWSIGDALDGRSSAVRVVVAIVGWSAWGVGVVALVVPSTFGLTIIRMVNALACGAAAVSWIDGAAPAPGAAFAACALIAGLLIGGAEFGQRCAQASAYGDEQRFLLRPPAAFLPPVAVAGLIWTAAIVSAPLLLASRNWAIGGLVAVICVLLTWLLLPRFHTLSRRWIVLVPAGVVVHDQVVLAETLMVPRLQVVGLELAPAGTEAADFTGPATGHAVEVRMHSMINALLAPTKDSPRGRALHVQSFIISPSRPGAVLRAARNGFDRPARATRRCRRR